MRVIQALYVVSPIAIITQTIVDYTCMIVTVSVRTKQIQAAISQMAGDTAKSASRRARIEAALAGIHHYQGVPCKCGNAIRMLSTMACVHCHAKIHLAYMRRSRQRKIEESNDNQTH